MAPATDQQPQQPDPEHGKSATRFGLFAVSIELIITAFLTAVGVRFLAVSGQSTAVAIVLFVIAAAILADCIRRIIRISRGRDRM